MMRVFSLWLEMVKVDPYTDFRRLYWRHPIDTNYCTPSFIWFKFAPSQAVGEARNQTRMMRNGLIFADRMYLLNIQGKDLTGAPVEKSLRQEKSVGAPVRSRVTLDY